MNINKEAKKTEAIRRMKALNLSNRAIQAFQKGEVWFSERPFGALYEIRDDELKRQIEAFEIERNSLVYHVTHTRMSLGDCWELWFVEDYPEEWHSFDQDIKEKICFVYVWNRTADWCSEYGTIGFTSLFGGLVRNS